MERITIYHDMAQVYLEGARALQPVDWMSESQISYYIGDETSNIRVDDYRTVPNQGAIEAIESKDRKSFHKSFSQPASVTIKEQDETILIELNEPAANRPDIPILRLGILKGEELTGSPVIWYALRGTGKTRTAFVALVRPGPTSLAH